MTINCNRLVVGTLAAVLAGVPAGVIFAAPSPATSADAESTRQLQDENRTASGTISVGGRKLAYRSETGVMVVHVKDPMDEDAPAKDEHGAAPTQPAEASMSYVAYFKGATEDSGRPVTFLFNGGPGVSTIWLHMGAFGPRRVVTADHVHGRAAPYRVVDNDYTLLDAWARRRVHPSRERLHPSDP